MYYLVSNQSQLFSSNLFNFISLKEGIELLKDLEEIGLDSETTGLDCYLNKILLLQLGCEEFQVLIDIKSYGSILPKELKDFLNNYKGLFILQNAKFDLKFLFNQEVIIKKVFDTFLAEIIITNGLQYSGRGLASLAEKYCDVALDKSVRSEILNVGLTDRVLVYGANDVKYLSIIKRKQLKVAKERDVINAINLDNSFVVVLACVEYCGIKLDWDKWKKKTDENVIHVSKLKTSLENQLIKDGKMEYFSGMQDLWSGKQDCILNWNSPKQVIKLLNDYGVNTSTVKKGVKVNSIDAKILEPQLEKFSILKPYLDYKGGQKLISTYGYNWKKYINPITGRIHTTFQQLMDTGRLSCGNKRDGTPNLQNLPSDKETRSCFIAEKDNRMTAADYSSQEQIVLANFSKEENLLNFYKNGFTDMHSYVAFLMYEDIRRCTLEELTPDKLLYIKEEYKEQRKLAKNAGFAINYGGNGSTISKNCNISKKDGEFVYDSYFEAFPNLREYFDLVFLRASHYGYIQFNNITKRKYFFNIYENDFFKYKEEVEDPLFWQTSDNARSINSKYNKAKGEIARLAQNYPIQGSASDITKYACILFFKEILIRGWWMSVKIVNLVHDEIIIEAPDETMKEAKEVLLNCMAKAGEPFCPIIKLGAHADEGIFWIH